MAEDAKTIRETFDQLKSERAPFDALYRQVAQYTLPDEASIPEAGGTTEGLEHAYPSESVGIRCARLLAAGLFSNTVSPGAQWFRLRATDEQLNEQSEVREWMDASTDRVLKSLAASNFSLELQELLHNFAIFGTSPIFIELTRRDAAARLNFRHYSIRGVYITEGPDGIVDGVYREFSFTARQAALEFGSEHLSAKLRDKVHQPEGNTAKAQFLHAVYRRPGQAGKESAGSKDMPWASVYMELDGDQVCREGGFATWPFAVPRCYKRDGETYGRSPAMEALGDLRQIERASNDWIDAVEMAMVPPVFMPDREAAEIVDLRPGRVNYYDPTRGGKPVLFESGGNAQIGEYFLNRKEQAVREAFFVDLFLALEGQTGGPAKTATEVAELVSEKIQAISPMVNRLQSELFAPLIIRCVSLLAEAGLLSEPPAVLKGRTYEVDYQTRLDARLADVETNNIMAALTQIGEVQALFAQFPDLRATVNQDEVYRALAHNRRVPMKMLRSPRETDKYRAGMQAAAEEQQKAAMLAEKVKPVDVTQPLQPGSMLAQFTGGGAGA